MWGNFKPIEAQVCVRVTFKGEDTQIKVKFLTYNRHPSLYNAPLSKTK